MTKPSLLFVLLLSCSGLACGDDGESPNPTGGQSGQAASGGSGGSSGNGGQAGFGGDGAASGGMGGSGGTTGGSGGMTGGSGGMTAGSAGTAGGSGGSGDCDPACGPHGECVPEGCACEAGYVGVTCASCDEGYVLGDDGETCSPDGCTAEGGCAGVAFLDQWGTDKNDVLYALALDDDGGLYAVGRTAGELAGHVSSGGADAIAGGQRQDTAERWTEQWGTGATEEATGLVIGDDGALFVSGHSSGVLGESMFGLADAVLTRLDSDHVVDWTVQWGTGQGDRPTKMVRSSDGALLVLGATAGNLGRTNPDTTKSDAFLTKLSEAGDIAWTTQWGADENEFTFGLAAGPAGSAYVVGGTAGDLVTDEHQGGVDLYCTKLSASGDIEWTVQWGSVADEYAYGVAVLPSGEALVVSERGLFEADEGTGAMLITKIDADGAVVWTRAFGVDNDDVARAIALDGDGSFYVAGVTYGDLAVDGHVGMGDVFVSKRDEAGVELWTQQYGTTEEEAVEAIALGADVLYVAGSTTGDAGRTGLGMTDNLIVGFELEP